MENNDFKELKRFSNLQKHFDSFERIGSGGYGYVYSGIFKKRGKRYAIKILNYKDDERRKADRYRFENEIAILTKIKHRNIVKILGSYSSDAESYYAMELIQGNSLKSIIAKNKKLNPEDVVNYAKEICDGLIAVHAANIVHRDLKPSNILITNDTNTVKLIDFGISLSETSLRVTEDNKAVGSVQYIAPEILTRSAPPSAQTDIYALGIIMYEMLTGNVPFSGSNHSEIMLGHINAELPPIPDVNVTIPQPLENIIIKCTAKEPSRRYVSATELYKDLETCLDPRRAGEKKLTLDDKKNKSKNKNIFQNKAFTISFFSVGALLIAIAVVLLVLLLKGVL
ncbi:serine/threonine protein kinase [Metamycoplasma neophronis]|uniref:Serine/threonine protein kinase n=1 Tax=Metamycoplasma neophronis TaxID=872983 RepID=A0ABY2Z0P3_9BACT|nr:serine/threonine-protein kinase [Metamycoplasma neophronis]TPR54725.1 serine/threonine protein kinase [Metamycoplasma neophronis]